MDFEDLEDLMDCNGCWLLSFFFLFVSQDVKAAGLNLEVVLQQNAASCIRRQQRAAGRSALRVHLRGDGDTTQQFVDVS